MGYKVVLAALFFSCGIVRGAWAQTAADSDQKVALGIEVIKTFCGTGASSSETQKYVGSADGGISLRRLPSIGAQANVTYTKKEAAGLAGALTDELTNNATDLSKSQIKCMAQFIPRVLDILLGAEQGDIPKSTPIDSYQIESPDKFCVRLKRSITSFGNGFKDIIVSGPDNFENYKVNLILPGAEYCVLSTMVAINGDKPYLYYSCGFTHDEMNEKNVFVMQKAYGTAVANCLGDGWTRADTKSTSSGHVDIVFTQDQGGAEVDVGSFVLSTGRNLYLQVSPAD